MPNNPARTRAGSPPEVSAGNRIVRRSDQATTVAGVVNSAKDNVAQTSAGPSGDFGTIPSGIIAMWGGVLADVPDGWNLCDGTNGTPDLRDQFIMGWTAAVDPGGTGGTTSHTHGAGTLAADAISAGTPSGTIPNHSFVPATPVGVSDIMVNSVNHTFNGDVMAPHAHTVSGDTANNTLGDALPPYFKLAFIQKA